MSAQLKSDQVLKFFYDKEKKTKVPAMSELVPEYLKVMSIIQKTKFATVDGMEQVLQELVSRCEAKFPELVVQLAEKYFELVTLQPLFLKQQVQFYLVMAAVLKRNSKPEISQKFVELARCQELD